MDEVSAELVGLLGISTEGEDLQAVKAHRRARYYGEGCMLGAAGRKRSKDR